MKKEVLIMGFLFSVVSYGCVIPTPPRPTPPRPIIKVKVVNKIKNVTRVKNVTRNKTVNKTYVTNNTYNTYEEVDNVSLDLAFIGALEGSKNSIPLIDGGDKGIGFGIGGSDGEGAIAVSFQMMMSDVIKIDSGVATNFEGETVGEFGIGFRF